MKVLWTLLKVVLAIALIVPAAIIILATVLGVLGTVLGLAILALKVAVAGLVAWGLFKLGSALLRGRSPRPAPTEVRQLPTVDPYYEAAKRELDRELGHFPR